MSSQTPDPLSSLSMFDLFRTEIENQTALLTAGLLELERNSDAGGFEALMRAAHSLKGAARIGNLQTAVRVAHTLEDCFVSAQRGRLSLKRAHIDILLKGVDLLANLGRRSESTLNSWDTELAPEIRSFLEAVALLISASAESVSTSSITEVSNQHSKPPGLKCCYPPIPATIRCFTRPAANP